MKNPHPPVLKIGAHVSAAGGLDKAVERVRAIGGNCLQIFGSSPRQWQVKLPDRSAVLKFRQAIAQTAVGPVFIHAPYLNNLASPEATIRRRSIQNLTLQMEIAVLIRAAGVIFHLGSGKQEPRVRARQRLASGMRRILANVSGNTWLIMENSAGGGQRLGETAEELRSLYDAVRSNRVKVCFDTAHALAAGLINSYTPARIRKLLREWDKLLGLQNIVVIHANDSGGPPGSHLDRHANLGQGNIGLTGFRNLARVSGLRCQPWILEVPGFDGRGPDKRNIARLKSCFADRV